MENESTIGEDERADLEAKHPRLLVLETDFGDAAFRLPKEGEWDRFLEEHNVPETRATALKHVVHACRVWPEKPVFDRMIAQAPGLVTSMGNELIEHVGVLKTAVRKK